MNGARRDTLNLHIEKIYRNIFLKYWKWITVLNPRENLFDIFGIARGGVSERAENMVFFSDED